ncbi:hypothetical protein EDD21DRAFT_84882, partial [Dissophora ornata]
TAKTTPLHPPVSYTQRSEFPPILPVFWYKTPGPTRHFQFFSSLPTTQPRNSLTTQINSQRLTIFYLSLSPPSQPQFENSTAPSFLPVENTRSTKMKIQTAFLISTILTIAGVNGLPINHEAGGEYGTGRRLPVMNLKEAGGEYGTGRRLPVMNMRQAGGEYGTGRRLPVMNMREAGGEYGTGRRLPVMNLKEADGFDGVGHNIMNLKEAD